jgi:hypothetical protein
MSPAAGGTGSVGVRSGEIVGVIVEVGVTLGIGITLTIAVAGGTALRLDREADKKVRDAHRRETPTTMDPPITHGLKI